MPIPGHAEPLAPTHCRLCWLWHHDARYRAAWSGPGRKPAVTVRGGAGAAAARVTAERPPTPRPRPPCRWEGEIVSHCPRDIEALHARQCLNDHDDAPDTCTRAHTCAGCPLYAPPDPPGLPPVTAHPPFRRSLAYHVYPVAGDRGGESWRWNVAELCERLDLFDGRRVVAVVTDPPTGRKPDPTAADVGVPPDGARVYGPCATLTEVQAAFGEHADSVEWIHLENDPHLREGVTLVPLLERVLAGATASDVFLYAHAKGTTRQRGHTARHWAECLYEIYLDHWPVVEGQLRRWPVTGAFKKLGNGWRPEQHLSDWHYSGSWFWCRSADLAARDWRTHDRNWTCVEPFPSQKFATAEGGCLFLEGPVPQVNLYSRQFWRRVVDPELNLWRRLHRRDRRPAPRGP